jgi:hypothetical protein
MGMLAMRFRTSRHRDPNDPVETVDMNEGLRTAMGARMMLGSRRTLLVFVVLVILLAAGYWAIQYYTDPLRDVRQADQLWDRDENVAAVRLYKDLLNRRDVGNPDYAMVPRRDRPRMYRRIITHEAVYGSPQEARDWITRAFLEGINFERVDFEHEQVFELWQTVIAPFREEQRREIDASRSRDLLNELKKGDK